MEVHPEKTKHNMKQAMENLLIGSNGLSSPAEQRSGFRRHGLSAIQKYYLVIETNT
jgi:hypothetical protein